MQFFEYGEKEIEYLTYGSVACLYLWELSVL